MELQELFDRISRAVARQTASEAKRTIEALCATLDLNTEPRRNTLPRPTVNDFFVRGYELRDALAILERWEQLSPEAVASLGFPGLEPPSFDLPTGEPWPHPPRRQ